MKRPASPEPNQVNKKQKTAPYGPNGSNRNLCPEELNFQPIYRRNFQYLVNNLKLEKPPGYVQGIVRMMYNLPEKDKFTLELAESSVEGRKEPLLLEVVLSKLHLKTLDPLVIKDTVKISLKGAQINRVGSKKHALPVSLSFTEGYHLRLAKREVMDINTFTGVQLSRGGVLHMLICHLSTPETEIR